jgi:hypothetical protein
MKDGKFRTAPRLRRFNEDGGFSFLGLALAPLDLSAFENEKIIHLMEDFFLCAGLAGSRESTPAVDILPISFRAAQAANLAIRPFGAGLLPDSFSFEWKITDPVWLPAPGK